MSSQNSKNAPQKTRDFTCVVGGTSAEMAWYTLRYNVYCLSCFFLLQQTQTDLVTLPYCAQCPTTFTEKLLSLYLSFKQPFEVDVSLAYCKLAYLNC
jgi:hypothetical protein